MNASQIEKLINLVSCYPQLYNSNNVEYADQHKRDRIWSVIGQELSLSPELCRAKWTILRSGYRKALRNNQGELANSRKKWRFEDSMSFLKDYIQKRGARRVFEVRKDAPEDDEVKAEREEQEDDRTSSCDSLTIAEVLKMTTRQASDEDGDAVTHFFLSMAETVKTLPPLVQARIKADVFSCVSAAEIKYLQRREKT